MRIKAKRRKDKAKKSKNIIFMIQGKNIPLNGIWAFPGGPVVRTQNFYCYGSGIQSLARELRSHKPCLVVKKVRNKNMEYKKYKLVQIDRNTKYCVNTGEWHCDHNLDQNIYFLLIMLMLFCLLIVFLVDVHVKLSIYMKCHDT